MLKSLQRIWKPAATARSSLNKHDVSLAVTVLMMHVMQQDDKIDASEYNEIMQATKLRFHLSEADAKQLITQATEVGSKASDLHQFTSPLVDAYTQQERIDIVRQLWRVAMADGHIDPYEEALIRKTAELIGVHHHQFIDAKISARKT